ncbi:MAG: MFS transporter, partial [Actinomycetes bacterium]
MPSAPDPPRNALDRILGGQPREVWILTSIAFAVALGFGIVAPAIALYAKTFGASDFLAGSVIAVFAAMRFVSSPFAGALVNRAGERLVLATGMGIVATSSA